MQIYFHNTLTRKKDLFIPISNKKITMYVCGPTVYNYAHIGNARPAVTFDLLYRFLQYFYKNVEYVRNITDVDDKIIQASAVQKISPAAIANRYTEAYHQDMQALNVLQPSLEPRATDYIPQMIRMIEKLIDRGNAYVSDGDVFFSISSYAKYGQLRHHKPDIETSRERIESTGQKKNVQDFALWKSVDDTKTLCWESPWGKGRPGWHLECSTMVQECLGLTIDIHGGGQDLIFPHHENEIAQGSCANEEKPYCNYWLHNAFVQLGDEKKMAKSLGNVLLVTDLVKNIPGEILRLSLLSTHYRSPIEWTQTILEQSRVNLDYLYQTCLDTEEVFSIQEFQENYEVYDPSLHTSMQSSKKIASPSKSFLEALADDLNVSVALAEMQKHANKINRIDKAKEASKCKEMKIELLACASIFGILQNEPSKWFQQKRNIKVQKSQDNALLIEEIEKYIQKRHHARAEKNYKEADNIRDLLHRHNIELEDKVGGKTIWKQI